MTSLNNKYTNNRSMNGLISIFAHDIETNNSVVNSSLIVDGENITDVVNQVDSNSFNLTGIIYSPIPNPTTNILNDLDCKKNFIIRDTIEPETVFMKLFYDNLGYGFRFLLDAPNRYMYFSVKNNAGNIRSFQFNHSQVYTNMPFYQDNDMTLNHNRNLYIGENGTSLKFIPNPDIAAGFQLENRFNNYYTNFLNRNNLGTSIYILRLHHSKITSLIDHEFINNIIVNGISITPVMISYLNNASSNIQTQLNDLQSQKFPYSGGTISGNLAITGSLNTTGITNLMITNHNGVCYNNEWSYFNKDIIMVGAGTRISVLGGTFVSQTDLSRITNLTANAQTQINSLASNQINFYAKTGGLISGNVSINGTLSVFNDIIFSNSIVDLVLLTGSVTLTQTELSHLSGITSNIQTQLNSKLNLTGGVISGLLHMNGTTATTNRITQAVIADDTAGGANLLKYTNLSYRSAGTTANPILTMIDTINNNTLWVFPNLGTGNFNNIVTAGSRGIIAGTPLNNNSLVLTTWGNTRNGIRIFTTGAAHAQTEIRAGDSSSIILNNATGIEITNSASIGFSDSTTQITAFTTAKNDKLVNIGTITTGVLSATSSLVSNSIFNCGEMTLTAGTYMITANCRVTVINAPVQIQQMFAGFSTSSTIFTQSSKLFGTHGGQVSFDMGATFSLNSTSVVVVPSTTIYYLLTNCVFFTPNRMEFRSVNSIFEAIRIA